MKTVSDAAVTAGYSAASFHPDGLILGTGTMERVCRVWDVKTQQNVVSFGACVRLISCGMHLFYGRCHHARKPLCRFNALPLLCRYNALPPLCCCNAAIML